MAASYGLIECLQLLERYGANLGMPSIDGATPLHEAAASGQPGINDKLTREKLPI